MFTVGPCPFCGYASKTDRIRSEQLRVVSCKKQPGYSGKLEEYSKQALSWRSTEGYKKSACEDLTCDLKTLCVL
jgi:glutaredoxin